MGARAFRGAVLPTRALEPVYTICLAGVLRARAAQSPRRPYTLLLCFLEGGRWGGLFGQGVSLYSVLWISTWCGHDAPK